MSVTLAVVYDRVSGDEAEGQDGAAQLAQVVHRSIGAGFNPAWSSREEDVPGDAPWADRKNLLHALATARANGAVVVVREVTRLWRGRPAEGLALLATVPDLEVLDAPEFARRGGAWLRDADADELLRFVGLWSSWSEKRRTIARVRFVMDELKNDRRATKSGRALGRPSVVDKITPDERAWCLAELERGESLLSVHRALLKRRGHDDVVTKEAKAARFVSYDSLARALGRRSSAKGDPPQKSEVPSGAELVRKGSVVRSAEPAVDSQNSGPDESGAARPAEKPGDSGAILDGGA